MVEQLFKAAHKKYTDLVEYLFNFCYFIYFLYFYFFDFHRFYGEDPVTCTPEEFFTILQKFHMLMENATNMNKKERDAEEKRVQKDKQACSLVL
jgi:hypothetical protein